MQTQPPPSAQLALSDLVILTILIGVVMLAWRAGNKDTFLPAGAMVSGMIGGLIGYLMLSAAKQGYSTRLLRWAYVAKG